MNKEKLDEDVLKILRKLNPIDRLVAIALASQGHEEALKRLFEEKLGEDWSALTLREGSA